MSSIAESKSLFEIDAELDDLLEEIQQEIESEGQPSTERLDRFQEFCRAHGEKVDRIGRFLRMMEARTLYCRSEANRLQERARSSERKFDQTKAMVLYHLESRGLKKIEGLEYALRRQHNSQDSVRIIDEHQIPMRYKVVEAYVDGTLWGQILDALPEPLKKMLGASLKKATPNTEAIKQAPEKVPGAECGAGHICVLRRTSESIQHSHQNACRYGASGPSWVAIEEIDHMLLVFCRLQTHMWALQSHSRFFNNQLLLQFRRY
jgi:hypothetical protein